MGARSSRVSHPVLHLDVLSGGGARAAEERVFCRLRRESIDVEYCRHCIRCDAIQAGLSVDCTVSLPTEHFSPDPQGNRTEIGALLRGGLAVVETSANLGEALGLLRAEDLRSVAVVGGDHILVGVLHEVDLSERCARRGASSNVASEMSSPLALHESTPIRPALRFLASAHLRQAAVVTSGGVPLGLFRDVDGLSWIARARKDAATSD